MTSLTVSEHTSQTHHPKRGLETLGADVMWHAIMQIIKVNMTHFLAYRRQFIQTDGGTFTAEQEGVSKDLLCRADGMTTVSLQRFETLKKRKKIKQRKALEGSRHGSGVYVGSRSGNLHIKASHSALTSQSHSVLSEGTRSKVTQTY